MKNVTPGIVVGELAVMSALLLSYIWLWKDAFPGDFVVLVVLYAAIGVASHLRRGETAHDIGFRLDNLASAARQALVYVGALVVVAILVGAALGTLRAPENLRRTLHLAVRLVWGTAQEYGLLAFFFLRFREIVPGKWPPTLAAASLFALFHLPNPFLTVAALGTGALSCWLYRRIPNLWALGIAHGVLSAALSRSLPADVTAGMRVGHEYWNFLEVLQQVSGVKP
jgi:hypothetical protein